MVPCHSAGRNMMAKGGPDGGDGGRGGNIVFVVDPGLRTLQDFRYKKKIQGRRRTKRRKGQPDRERW